MISFLSGWIQKIAVSVIIVGVFELILPNSNLKKYIKVVLGIYVVFCIISPFVNNSVFYNLGEMDLEDYVENITEESTVSTSVDSNDLDVQEIYVDELKGNIEKLLEDNGYKMCQCNIDADFTTTSLNPGIHKIDLVVEKAQEKIANINSIEIEISNEHSMDMNENNSGLTELKETLANYYEINKDIINIALK